MKKIKFLFTEFLPTCVKLLLARLLILFGYADEYKDCWLIAERGTDARDNGYFFFRYLREKHSERDAYYVIAPDSADAHKLPPKRWIRYRSLLHYAVLLRAKILISSHIMGFTPSWEVFLILQKKKILKLPGKQVFLQHGITKANIEGLKYPNIQVDLFLCGAYAEYEYIKNTYRHPNGVVRYTGFARYDTLQDARKPQIVIMPTWRKWLNHLSDKEFQESDYYRKYYQLLTDSDLKKWLAENGLTLFFYLHYELQRFCSLFDEVEGDYVRICGFSDADVQTLLNTSSLLITDYSSVCFDFAYLQKPILFYQFDRENFLDRHYAKGYFDPSAFGPIAEDCRSLIQMLISSYNGTGFFNGYEHAQKSFFGDLKPNCCDRIFEAVRELTL